MKHSWLGLVWALLASAIVAVVVLLIVIEPRIPASVAEVPGGSPDRGRLAIARYGCGACHTIPGVAGADGMVGPPLTAFGSRGVIAGRIPNNGPNLIRWIEHPDEVEPGTDMPDLHLSEQEARDIAAYLFSLK